MEKPKAKLYSSKCCLHGGVNKNTFALPAVWQKNNLPHYSKFILLRYAPHQLLPIVIHVLKPLPQKIKLVALF